MQFSSTQFLTLAVVLAVFGLGHSANSPGGNRSDPPGSPTSESASSSRSESSSLCSTSFSSSTPRAAPTPRASGARRSATTRGHSFRMIKSQQAFEFEDPDLNFPDNKYWAQLGEKGPWVKISDENPKMKSFTPVMSQHDYNFIDRAIVNGWFSGIYTAKNSQRVKLVKRDLNQYEVMTRVECARSRIHKQMVDSYPIPLINPPQ